ncbi:MAG: DUF255 domain-containing protein [Dehalococcoidia bacterium]|nr:DUF255 domain-containing protein [Dehalococcoidia bacterium]
MANRLENETSPYLLQHKDNPVDWFPWGDEAFETAKRLDKPVLLSVGYSACHWCHVMAHESFEDPTTAQQMNQGFVNIKVDREERPDVDNIYMQAVQALTGRGGWPMTVFLLPDGVPFYGGTYFPPADYGGMPAFSRVLTAVGDAYKTRRDELQSTGKQLTEHIAGMTRLQPGDQLLSATILDQAAESILAEHDPESGGFGPAPKFPQPMTLDFLMRYHQRSKRDSVLEAVETTLHGMAFGGMYDHLGGGFHRYSTDAMWLVPHFEKMLYDNAQLARVYLDAFKLTDNPFYLQVAGETLDYVLRDMTGPEGGFYSSQDADSEGEEGKFYMWTPNEFRELLGEDAEIIGRYYRLSEDEHLDDPHILHVEVSVTDFAEEHGLDPDDFGLKLRTARDKLLAARTARVHPGRDDKAVTSWNALMLRALAEAALTLDNEHYRRAAVRNADFLLDNLRQPQGVGGGESEAGTSIFRSNRLLRSWKDGSARNKGYLEDYALLIDGLIAVYEATFEPRYLSEAIGLADAMIDLFWDESAQAFFDTGRDHEALITRPRHLFDNAMPSGTSVATGVLLRLALLTGNTDYERRATAGLRALAPMLSQSGTSFGHLLCALDFYVSRPQELAVVWPAPSSAHPEDSSLSAHPEVHPEPGRRALEGRGHDLAKSLIDAVRAVYAPRLLLVGAPEGSGADLTPLLADRPTRDGQPTAYLCERFVCQAPTSDPGELAKQLEAANS